MSKMKWGKKETDFETKVRIATLPLPVSSGVSFPTVSENISWNFGCSLVSLPHLLYIKRNLLSLENDSLLKQKVTDSDKRFTSPNLVTHIKVKIPEGETENGTQGNRKNKTKKREAGTKQWRRMQRHTYFLLKRKIARKEERTIHSLYFYLDFVSCFEICC